MLDKPTSKTRTLLHAALSIGIAIAAFYLLSTLRAFLIPLVLALIAFYLVGILDGVWVRLPVVGRRIPKPVATVLSSLIILLAVIGSVYQIALNAAEVARGIQKYEDRLLNIYRDTSDRFQSAIRFWEDDESADGASPEDGTSPEDGSPGGHEEAAPDADDSGSASGSGGVVSGDDAPLPRTNGVSGAGAGEAAEGTDAGDGNGQQQPAGGDEIDRLADLVDIGPLLNQIAASGAAILGNGALIAVYLFFMLLERQFLDRKLRLLVPEEAKRRAVLNILSEVDHDVRVYIGVKTFVSFITAVFSYAVMRAVGLDFAEFWALLIFIMNYIPNIGSLIATALPTLLALVQFDSIVPFLVVGIGISTVQMTVANLIEPNLMGRSLNLSPLVIVISLVAWGLLWGIAGAFLCVPITAIAVIVMSHFPSTRWIAILLSRDGNVRQNEEGAADTGP